MNQTSHFINLRAKINFLHTYKDLERTRFAPKVHLTCLLRHLHNKRFTAHTEETTIFSLGELQSKSYSSQALTERYHSQ